MASTARDLRSQGRRIGLVPTAGGLHEGHLSLATRAGELCDCVIVSITHDQNAENPPTDIARDAELASNRGTDFIFAPAVDDILAKDLTTFVTVEGLSEKLEGASLPGYFRDSTTVVNKLFNIVQPHFAFFGRKDAQETIIIKRMVRDLAMNVEVVVCPVVREEDGLALSAANARLSTDERKAAVVLRRALERCQSHFNNGVRDAERLIGSMRAIVESEPLARIDYAAVTDTERLEPVVMLPSKSPSLVSLAVYIGAIRLTDNIVLEGDL